MKPDHLKLDPTGSIDLTSLLDAEEQYRAGNPKPLADFIRKYGVLKWHSAFVADVILGTFKRTKHDTHLPREKERLYTLSSFIWHYKSQKKLVAEHPEFFPDFANLDEVYNAVAMFYSTTYDAIKKLEQRARKREADNKSKAARKNKADK